MSGATDKADILMPKVSLIVPVYNAEKYLQRCIDSLINQTYENIEYIFVDDGSNDSSPDILRELKTLRPDIVIISQNNAGVSAARNAGLKICSGEYVMFCDSDDEMLPDMCGEMVRAAVRYPGNWILCGIEVIDEEGQRVNSYLNSDNDIDIMPLDEYSTLFWKGLSGFVYNKIFTRNIIEKSNIIFDEDIQRGEDVLFNLAYLRCCTGAVVINRLLYKYYKYDTVDTLTNTYHDDNFDILSLLYKSRYPFIKEACKVDYEKYYWHIFEGEFYAASKKENIESFVKRRRVCKNIVSSEDFQKLLLKYGVDEMNTVLYGVLRRKLVCIYFFIEKIHSVKNKRFCNK